MRVATTYPWFPEQWSQEGFDPATHFQPWEGNYDSSDLALIRATYAAMEYGHIDGALLSNWGENSPTDLRFGQWLIAAHGTNVKPAVYYEPGIPTVVVGGIPRLDTTQLKADLDHYFNDYASDPSYLLAPDGRPMLWVYGRTVPGAPKLQALMQVNNGRFFVNVQAQPSPIRSATQPDAWHRYATTLPEAEVVNRPGMCFSISPGFWRFDQEAPALARDPVRWQQNVQHMVASKSTFQMINTFDEWGEGTSVANALDWATPDGQGSYLDALAQIV